jgi:Predicted membrane protein (DUF2232)
VAGGRWRGWLAILALAIVTTASVVRPALLIFVPLALLLLALPPRRPLMVGVGLLIVFMAATGPAADPWWYAARGWALLLGGWFLGAIALLPNARFLARGLIAVAGSYATAAVVFAASAASFASVDARIARLMRTDAAANLEVVRRLRWGPGVTEQMEASVYQFADWRALLFPGLLALASLAALAIAWWGYRRLSGAVERPLAPLREFRFPDALVWLLIVGVALLLLPVGALAERAGSNLLTFMAALYALRGAAVLLALGGVIGPFGMLIAAALLLLLYPIVVITTVLVGLSDTWLDIRTRREAPQEPGA